jgi:hypothetical protein
LIVFGKDKSILEVGDLITSPEPLRISSINHQIIIL